MVKGVDVGVEELGFFDPMGCDILGCRQLVEEVSYYGMHAAFIFSCCGLGISNGLYLPSNSGVVEIVVGGSYVTCYLWWEGGGYFVGWVWGSGEHKRLACWMNYGAVLCLVLKFFKGIGFAWL